MHLGGIVDVDRRDHLGHGRVAAVHGRQHLSFAISPVLEVVAQRRLCAEHDRAVPRIDRGRSQVEHPRQGPEILRQITVRRIDEARATAEHRIPVNNAADDGTWKATWSLVWPGVWTATSSSGAPSPVPPIRIC